MKYDAGIILSHWLLPDGSLSDETRERVDRGIELWEGKEVEYLVMVGDHKLRGQKFLFSLAEAMKNYAVKKGVDAKKVIEEDIDLETVGNLLFPKYAVIEPRGWKNILIITHDYHGAKAREIAERVFGKDYNLGYSFVDSKGAKMEGTGVELFRETYEGIRPGDSEAMLERTLQKHARYNSEPDFFRERLERLKRENSKR